MRFHRWEKANRLCGGERGGTVAVRQYEMRTTKGARLDRARLKVHSPMSCYTPYINFTYSTPCRARLINCGIGQRTPCFNLTLSTSILLLLSWLLILLQSRLQYSLLVLSSPLPSLLHSCQINAIAQQTGHQMSRRNVAQPKQHSS